MTAIVPWAGMSSFLVIIAFQVGMMAGAWSLEHLAGISDIDIVIVDAEAARDARGWY